MFYRSESVTPAIGTSTRRVLAADTVELKVSLCFLSTQKGIATATPFQHKCHRSSKALQPFTDEDPEDLQACWAYNLGALLSLLLNANDRGEHILIIPVKHESELTKNNAKEH